MTSTSTCLCDFVERLDPRALSSKECLGKRRSVCSSRPTGSESKNDLVLDIQRRFEERNVIQGARECSQVSPDDTD